MNSKGAAAVLIAIIVLVGGYLVLSSRQSIAPAVPEETTQQQAAMTEPSPTTEATDEAMMEKSSTMTVQLSEQSNSGQSGTATLKEVAGKVVVSLILSSGGSSVSQPAHIHLGACPKPGEVKYPLTNVAGGKSETTLAVNMATLHDELPLAINVHKSATEVSVYTACGDIK